MTRQESYIAELSQLLFYMTPWDKAEVLKGITAMINHPETGLQSMEELGNPMKLAVTLHRQYTPTPEPTEDAPVQEAVAEAEEAAEEAAVEIEPAEEVAEDAVTEAPEEPAAEEIQEDVSEAEQSEETSEEEAAPLVEESAEEAVEVEEAAEEEAAEASAVEEAESETAEEPHAEAPAEEEAVPSLRYEERTGQEKIFAEIFQAATEAQSAVFPAVEEEKEVRRKARYLFLIPYLLAAIVIGVPVTLVFALANVAVFAVSLVCLAAVVYLVLFWLLPTVGLANKLIVVGLTVLMAAATILLFTMTAWFLRTATMGFPRFLFEIARKYGYREVEVQ